MDMRQAMDLVINFFTELINKIFSIEFFDGVEFGKIALFVLATSLLLDILLEIMGRGRMSENDDTPMTAEDRYIAENRARGRQMDKEFKKQKKASAKAAKKSS